MAHITQYLCTIFSLMILITKIQSNHFQLTNTLIQGRQHEFQSGGAKTQPIFRCYNFSFETLYTWKSNLRHSSIFDH